MQNLKNLLTRKNAIILGLVIIVILIVLVAFLTPESNNTPNQTANVTQTVNNTSNNPGGTSVTQPQPNMTYKKFLESGSSEICTFNVNVYNQDTAGTVYAANGKIRADFAVPTATGTIQQHMLIDSYTAYLWTNASNNGVKFAVQDNSPTQITKNTNFKCNSWNPNNSVFELPVNIIFTDISSGNPTPAINP